MSQFLQQLIGGIGLGVVYGGIALALSVVYAGTGVLNFAQGEMAAFSTFIAWALIAAGFSFWPALVLVVVASFLLGMLVERVLIRPVANAPELSILMVTLGILLALNSLMGIIWGYLPKAIESPFGTGTVEVAGATITAQQIGMPLTMLGVLALIGALFSYTNLGLRLRAAAQNPTSSRLLGVNVGLHLMIGWGLAAAVGAVAGMLSAPIIGISPEMMSTIILLAFAAAAMGGFLSRVGAVVGGIAIGVITNLSATYIPGVGGDLDTAVPLIVIVILLLVRPQGIFGGTSSARA